ncbi:digestive cysteine proteinase 2-like [Erpetoichthys calabaricus]|uniref:Zgc:110239 n=1 Tax=Erpetoichthys calabaricus TaxID=27687 RepID=A0A8C4SVY9_ERPCA|nr:digestive cysteine proteinase 2-like [Erpetoichthys calabaricus]
MEIYVMEYITVILSCTCMGLLESRPLTKPPDFGTLYHVSGIISLPYAEIQEPFEAWYNLSGNVSRINYYHGQVVTFQLGYMKPSGASYKITPETTESVVNAIKCFQVNGTTEEPVLPQSAFPNLNGFQFLKEDYYKGQLCQLWQNVTIEGKKKNTYTLWVTNSSNKAPIPVHYEMLGYNSLLGSHYDKYEIDYMDFSHTVDPSVFTLPAGLQCTSFPGPGMEHRILANPMQDFVHTEHEGHTHQLFGHFKKLFQRLYETEMEHEVRKHAFVHNLRYIHSMNRKNLSFKLAMNHLTDCNAEELLFLRGQMAKKTTNKGQAFPHDKFKDVLLPESFDWRLYGAVTPVKDQAICGSCWSFATTGALEGALFLKTGSLVVLSQQMLVDCSWGFGNNGCDGGEEWRAYEWVMKHGGIATAESYGPYMGQNGYCHFNQSEMTAKVKSYTNVTSGDLEALKTAIFKNGPVAVSIDASHKSFVFYSNGVYYEPQCGSKPQNLDHAVLAVGFGVLNGEPYWLIKNSWSTYWGNDGYILMSMKDNNCGVATDATFVTLE